MRQLVSFSFRLTILNEAWPFTATFGIPLLFTAPPQMAFFQCGAVRLLAGVTPAGQKAQRGSQIYFAVKDIQSVYSSLNNQGVQFKASPHGVNRSAKSEVWLAEFVDPDGNQLALMSELPLSDV
jgi:methylmalonyl-CoA/ethylmalonyl-CoA epimerase